MSNVDWANLRSGLKLSEAIRKGAEMVGWRQSHGVSVNWSEGANAVCALTAGAMAVTGLKANEITADDASGILKHAETIFGVPPSTTVWVLTVNDKHKASFAWIINHLEQAGL